MSTAGTGLPANTKETAKDNHRKSLGKYVKRMSTVFKRDKSTKAKSSAPAIKDDKEAATEEKNEAAPASSSTIEAESVAADAATVPAEASQLASSVVVHLQRSLLQQERARALFAKYGMTLESHEWIAMPAPAASVERVEKSIRMRVHRTCHHCGTTYGADKACVKCEHKRCKKCPRYPKKKSPTEKAEVQAKEAADTHILPKKKKVLTLTTKSGQMAYQPAKQRVRRNCHKCNALFIPPTATICESCRHIRCTKCPRDPAKLSKWPNGYPGDAEYDSENELERELERARRIWRKPRTRVRWGCERCNSTFLDGSPQCPGCGHEKCDQCLRKPIKRVKAQPSFDPGVVRSVEDKLRNLQVEEDQNPPRAVEAT